MTIKPFYVAGEWRTGEGTLDVHSPYDDSVVATLGVPTDKDVEDAVVAATETFKESRHLPTYVRSEALMHVSRRIAERVDELAEVVAREHDWKKSVRGLGEIQEVSAVRSGNHQSGRNNSTRKDLSHRARKRSKARRARR